MTSRRAVAYIGGASLLLAWLAAASGDARRAPAPRAPAPRTDDALMQTIASDVQAQAVRLRQRLASAPAPSPVRNPFAFDVREPRPSRRAAAGLVASIAEPAAPAIVEPAFILVGIAEQKTPVGLIRTAMLAIAGDDLIMAREGQTIALRFRITAIGTDVIELTDVTTGAIRRLALQQ